MTSTWRRRIASVGGLFTMAIVLVVTAPLWLPVVAVVDLLRLRYRLPTVRLLLFAVWWSWCETAGVIVAFGLWSTGRRNDRAAHRRLQTWWANALLAGFRRTTGITVEVRGEIALRPGPVVLLGRHASLADSLLSAWVITTGAGMAPRYVLKRELLVDPCLDIVGHRLPNHFLDRHAVDSAPELAALTALTADLGTDDAAVIFPEGTRSSPAKRSAALAKIAERDPDRATRLTSLRHLLPPRPAGAAALLAGCPSADVVLGWHVGFDGFDTFGGALKLLARRPMPVVYDMRRVARAMVPDGQRFGPWLDEQWQLVDDEVDQLIGRTGGPQ